MWRAAYGEAQRVPELDAGFLVERFNQTPWQLGLTDGKNIGFLYRALEAVHVYRAAQKYQGDWAKNPRSISDDEWRTISAVRKELRRMET